MHELYTEDFYKRVFFTVYHEDDKDHPDNFLLLNNNDGKYIVASDVLCKNEYAEGSKFTPEKSGIIHPTKYWMNHLPHEVDVKVPYTGLRYKVPYDVWLKDGTFVENCSPNGDSWYPNKNDTWLKEIKDKDVEYIQLNATNKYLGGIYGCLSSYTVFSDCITGGKASSKVLSRDELTTKKRIDRIAKLISNRLDSNHHYLRGVVTNE